MSSCAAVVLAVLAVCGTGQAEVTADYQKNGVQLSWTEPAQRISGERLFSSEIAGYNIFRCVNGEKDYRKINNRLVKDTRYIDRSVEWGMCYSYALTTVDKQGLEGPRSTLVQAIPPLGPPSNVKAFGLKRSVSLTWDKTNNPQIRGYKIYRSEASGQEYRKIASVLDTDRQYLDQELAVGKNYYYQVSAVDTSWKESAPSPEVAATPLVISQEELSTLEKVNGFRATVDLMSGNVTGNGAGNSGNGTRNGAGEGTGNGAVILQWEPIMLENLAGYNVYRRSKENEARGAAVYQKLNKNLLSLSETTFRDEDVKRQKSYYYTIAAVDNDKNEARFPREIYVTVADLYINSLTDDSNGLPLKGGKPLRITMIAAPGKKASVSLGDAAAAKKASASQGDVAMNIPLRETDQKGVYYGQYLIPQDINGTNLSLIGTVQDEKGEKMEYVSKDMITIDNLPPPGARAVKAQVAEGSVCLSWELSRDLDHSEQSDDIAVVKVFRSAAQEAGSAGGTTEKEVISNQLSDEKRVISNQLSVISKDSEKKVAGINEKLKTEPYSTANQMLLQRADNFELKISLSAEGNHGESISGEISPAVSSFCDHTIQPNQGYTYSVAVYDKAGNEAFSENCFTLVTPADSTPPKIYSVKECSSPGTKRWGDVIRIQVTGEAHAEGKFSIGSKIRQPLKEVGPGRYLGEYTVEKEVISNQLSVISKDSEKKVISDQVSDEKQVISESVISYQ